MKAPRSTPGPSWKGFEREADPYYSSARLWDDGVIDPAETREVLSLGLQAPPQRPHPRSTFGVFRM